jgi:DNA replication protein DnaC
MANLIPRVMSPNNPSDGEIHLFKRFEQDENTLDWHVLHSLNIAHHKTQVMGEIDFLVMIPNICVFAIEVKAHRFVKFAHGMWYLGKDSKGDSKSPFRQVNDATFSLIEYLKTKNNDLSHLPIFPLVLFTHTELNCESIEWHPAEVCCAKEYRKQPISTLLLKRAKFFKNRLNNNTSVKWQSNFESRPSDKDIHNLIDVLRPEIELFGNEIDTRASVAIEIEAFTKEQFVALDAMADNPRVLFKGPAGVGKTVLAAEVAMRAKSEGKNVLFLCKNTMLARFLRDKYATASLTILTITELLESIVSAEFKQSKNRQVDSYWNSELPEEAYGVLLNDEQTAKSYDFLVIDEAQDILINENWLDCVELVVDKGFSSGNWYVFGDFDFQNLYSLYSSTNILESFQQRTHGFPTFKLSINCRNIKKVSDLSFSLCSLELPYSKHLRNNQPIAESKYYFYKSESELKKKLLEQIKYLINQGFSPSDIVILSKVAESKSTCFKYASEFGATRFDFCENSLQYTSIHKFKGLEAPIIILVDFDEIESEQSKKLLYAGASRATESVIYLFGSLIREYLIKN